MQAAALRLLPLPRIMPDSGRMVEWAGGLAPAIPEAVPYTRP